MYSDIAHQASAKIYNRSLSNIQLKLEKSIWKLKLYLDMSFSLNTGLYMKDW